MTMTFNTVVESPQAQLRRALGLGPVSSSAPRVSDWMKLSVGDRFIERDGRHAWRVESIINSHNVVAKCQTNGYFCDEFTLADFKSGYCVKLEGKSSGK